MTSTYDENVVDCFRISRVIDHLFDIGENGTWFLSNLYGIATGRVHHVAGCSSQAVHCLWSPIVGVGVAFWTLDCRYILSQTSYYLVLLTHQGDKLLVRSFEFDEQRLEVGRLLE